MEDLEKNQISLNIFAGHTVQETEHTGLRVAFSTDNTDNTNSDALTKWEHGVVEM